MPDNRMTTYDGLVQTLFLDKFEADPLPATPLEALAIKDLVPVHEGANTFKVFTDPDIEMDSETLDEFRSRTSNNILTTDPSFAGGLQSKSVPLKDETLKADKVASLAIDLDGTAGVDAKFNSPERVAARAWRVYRKRWSQEKQNEIAKQALYSDNWLVPTTATISLSSAVADASTTFSISDTEKVSSGILEGDFVKIGNQREPNALDGAQEVVDVALVISVGANGSGGASQSLITIETDTANFPKSRNKLNGKIFKSLKTSLNAHALGTRVQIDRPYASVAVANIDSIITRMNTVFANNFITGGERIIYTTPEVIESMFGTSASGVQSQPLANDFLGKEVLTKNITTYMYRGFKIISDANAIARHTAVGSTALVEDRHYIWGFENMQAFAYAQVLSGTRIDVIPRTAGLLKVLSIAHLHDSMMSRKGAQKSLIVPVTIA